MPSRNINDLDPQLQILAREFLAQCAAKGIKAGIDCTYRSDEEQNADYNQGRGTPGNIVTDAEAGQSAHNCVDAKGNPSAKAFDFYIENPDGSLNWNSTSLPWQQAIEIGVNLGLVSGANFKGLKDMPHFELQDWNSL